MKLASAAKAFDQTVCVDGYTGDPAFKGQIAIYDDNKRDSETAERRVLSTAPGIAMPTRRVIAIHGVRYIIGTSYADDFRGSTIRLGWVAHEATALASIMTLAQLCLGTTGVAAWAGRVWVKDKAETDQSSELVNQVDLHLSTAENIAVDNIILYDGAYHVVRAQVLGEGGTRVVKAEQMPEPVVETATVVAGSYDPLMGQVVGMAPETARVVRVRWQSMFRYGSHLAPKFGPDDVQIAIAKASLAIDVGAQITLSDGTWVVQSKVDGGGVWLYRATRHV